MQVYLFQGHGHRRADVPLWTGTLDEFVQTNQDIDGDQLAELTVAVASGAAYELGGGAEGEFTLIRADG